jgi:hypothetical protein
MGSENTVEWRQTRLPAADLRQGFAKEQARGRHVIVEGEALREEEVATNFYYSPTNAMMLARLVLRK